MRTRAAVAVGLTGVFIETHEAPDTAPSEGPNMIPLDEMDALIEKLEVTLALKDRLPIWHRIQQLYAEELPVLPLYFRANAFVIPRWLKGIRPTGHLNSSSLWVEEWHAGGQRAEKQ